MEWKCKCNGMERVQGTQLYVNQHVIDTASNLSPVLIDLWSFGLALGMAAYFQSI